jgi:hypothetical protein
MKPLSGLVRFVLLWLVIFAAAYVIGGLVALAVTLVLVPIYWALVIRGSDARRERASEKLASTLIPSEQRLREAIQLRLCALLSRRLAVAATSSRVIVIQRSLLGGFTMKDYQWKDLHDASLSENVLPNLFGSRLSLAIRRDGTGAEERLVLDGFESRVASQIYSTAQDQEQAWEEKRRVRAMEEARASSGGVTLGGYAPPSGGGGGSGSALDELERAKKLLDSGVISDAEFNEMKSKILSRQAF